MSGQGEMGPWSRGWHDAVPAPCMRPGLWASECDVGARTHPLDSCMMIARMKEAGMEDWADSERILDLMAEVSAGELLAPQVL